MYMAYCWLLIVISQLFIIQLSIVGSICHAFSLKFDCWKCNFGLLKDLLHGSAKFITDVNLPYRGKHERFPEAILRDLAFGMGAESWPWFLWPSSVWLGFPRQNWTSSNGWANRTTEWILLILNSLVDLFVKTFTMLSYKHWFILVILFLLNR